MEKSFIPRQDLDFMLRNWLQTDALASRPEFEEHSPETFSAILDVAEKLAASAFSTHYKKADQCEPILENGKVSLIPEIKDALTAFADAGFFSGPFAAQLGGLQLPNVISTASMAYFMAANIATSAYPMLTMANARLIAKYGSTSQIEAFAIPQISGCFFGTMCLSEPHAGSSLSDISTVAVYDGEDELGFCYRIHGSKMWISGAEHDLSDNIMHLVLAKTRGPDGKLRPGTKGISLFIVPKILPEGKRNDVAVSGLNHKMGYRGTVNCLLQFGEHEGAVGWRVGGEGEGLTIMFHMMNEARIMVGLGAAALAYRGYRQSLEYAKVRPQGRAIATGSKGGRATSPVPIIRHADVRRMLIAQKTYAEGALALVMFCASLVDDEHTHPEVAARNEARELLDLLTPIVKAWPAEFGLAANDLAIQIHGGYGYTRDFDVEQLYRDNRLNPIHEGTNGIQAIDLVGRKLASKDGASLGVLEARMSLTWVAAAAVSELAPCGEQLRDMWHRVRSVAQKLSAETDRSRALMNAHWFLKAFGHVVVAWIWMELALAALRTPALDCNGYHRAGKMDACRYYFRCELPNATHWLNVVETFDESSSDIPEDHF